MLDLKQFTVLYLKMMQTHRTLWVDFVAFQSVAKQMLQAESSGIVTAQAFYELVNNYIRQSEGYKTHLTTMQRVANENAFLAVAEVYDVADVNTVGECDADILIMVIKMYLSDW